MTRASVSQQFYRVITDAVRDIAKYGFDNERRIDDWMARIRDSAWASMPAFPTVERELRRTLTALFDRAVKPAAVPARITTRTGPAPFTITRVQPKLRAELERRIHASAQLIRLNRTQSIDRTLSRFQGWATSVPAGGSTAVNQFEEAATVRKALAQLPYEERRVAVDQGHKLVASVKDIIAVEGGAIAAIWRSKWRETGYNYRKDHKERDGHVYLLRGSWALEKGLVKPGPDGYTDQITTPAEEPFCRCAYQYVYALRDLPDELLTVKGKEAVGRV